MRRWPALWLPAAACGLALLGASPSCMRQPRPRTIHLETLEAAMEVRPALVTRVVVSDSRLLRKISCLLGERLLLVQVRTEQDWKLLSLAAPELGECPDLEHGSVIGLACRVGTPLEGDWPIELQTVRTCNGAGLVSGRFQGGTYLPDGVTFLELAYVDGLASVLVVDVNGDRFFPE